jgi:hypothetical protein
VARKKGPTTRYEDLPEWMHKLKGYDEITVEQLPDGGSTAHIKGVTDATEFEGGTWRVSMTLPTDLKIIAAQLDPLILLTGLAAAAQEVDNKLTELVRFCRTEGKTWTMIGEALGMSKQAAWERFSGED